MIRTYGLTHIGLTVRDIDRTIAFYQEVFGARVLYNNGATAELNTPGCHDIIALNSGRTSKVRAVGTRNSRTSVGSSSPTRFNVCFVR